MLSYSDPAKARARQNAPSANDCREVRYNRKGDKQPSEQEVVSLQRRRRRHLLRDTRLAAPADGAGEDATKLPALRLIYIQSDGRGAISGTAVRSSCLMVKVVIET